MMQKHFMLENTMYECYNALVLNRKANVTLVLLGNAGVGPMRYGQKQDSVARCLGIHLLLDSQVSCIVCLFD